MNIRRAIPQDSATLTEISFASKGYWNYPPEYFEIWKNELTITAAYIETNHVYLIEENGRPVGYYAVVILEEEIPLPVFVMEPGVWLEHVFVRPEEIGRGYGRRLMRHLGETAAREKWEEIKILVDPHACDFYQKLGATFIKDVPSNIEGRTVAYFKWSLSKR